MYLTLVGKATYIWHIDFEEYSLKDTTRKGEVEIEGGIKLPGAANMQFMAYNCSLEERATELTERCERLPDRTKFSKRRRNFADFDYTISNGPISVAKEAVEKWWNQKPKWQELQNISENDYSAIPFFLMAQAEIDQIGCSVSLCKKDGESSYYTVGCVYGKRVKSDSELYQKGPACSTCEKNCYKNVLCKKP
uniref:SCP extracellular domain containing protein n=1 Tax=Haemonchus contortus TaxID=6289 RepID=U6P5Q7_HAECO|nr:SCP extracellular domain containing protein [Haemonchus contortus]CDJ88116.1 SCP extracellular domain containing protein [Haemonchus contortus]